MEEYQKGSASRSKDWQDPVGGKEEATNQYAVFHENKGGRETGEHEGSKRAQATPERPRRGSAKVLPGKEPKKATMGPPVNLIQVKSPTEQMIKLAKTLEVLDLSKWIVHGKTVKKISEQELNLVVITLAANRIYNHKKRPTGTTNREIATVL